MTDLTKPIFHDDMAARRHLESIRWPDGPVCPHCTKLEPVRRLRKRETGEETGILHCKDCRKKFTVTVGTIFERTHIPLAKWVLAFHLMCASKKGMSAHQLHRMLGVTYKTAWFMAHRIREAMKPEEGQSLFGGVDKTVEADETFIGNVGKHKKGARGYAHKEKVLSFVERKGSVRSQHVPKVNADTLRPILNAQIDLQTRLITDEARQYIPIGKDYALHGVVQHGIGEYVRGDIHTNTIEGYFSIFKRGMQGVYQHCSAKHLKRYLAEFDFRYNERKVSDSERVENGIKGALARRITYQELREPLPVISSCSMVASVSLLQEAP